MLDGAPYVTLQAAVASANMHMLDALPIVALPTGLSNTNTGNLIADVLPLLTMLPCVPTLHLYYRTKRWPDLVRRRTSGYLLAHTRNTPCSWKLI